jgi:hypothetical protein
MTDQKPDNGLLNIFFTVLAPVLILNNLTERLGAGKALVLALAFPIGFGLFDLVKKRKFNGFALLGVLNVSITGGFALLHLQGIWFAVKEAAFPLLIGVFVFASQYTRKPFVRTLFFNPQLLNIELIEEKLKDRQNSSEFDHHLRKSTGLLSLSFLLSAVLNFALAMSIFSPLAPGLDETAQAVELNQQIAKMTSWSLLVILLPSMIFLAGVLWYLLRGIHKLTGLTQAEIFKT